jgi:hypothetical protein
MNADISGPSAVESRVISAALAETGKAKVHPLQLRLSDKQRRGILSGVNLRPAPRSAVHPKQGRNDY